MALPNLFEKSTLDTIKSRINSLDNTTTPQWGKMNVAQMLAHCNVTYEMLFTDKHPKPNAFVKLMLKLFVKNKVVGESTYQKNGQTAPQFIISDVREFEKEKTRLIDHIDKVYELGASYFEGKESHSFGTLSTTEWNNMMYKHLDHHLTQFGK